MGADAAHDSKGDALEVANHRRTAKSDSPRTDLTTGLADSRTIPRLDQAGIALLVQSLQRSSGNAAVRSLLGTRTLPTVARPSIPRSAVGVLQREDPPPAALKPDTPKAGLHEGQQVGTWGVHAQTPLKTTKREAQADELEAVVVKGAFRVPVRALAHHEHPAAPVEAVELAPTDVVDHIAPRLLKDLPMLMTIEETAAFLKLPVPTVPDAIRKGQIPHVEIGRRRYVPTPRLVVMLTGAA